MRTVHPLDGVTIIAQHQLAERVGYESEAAFNRAFKRAVGLPPAAWRKSTAQAAAGSGVSRSGKPAGSPADGVAVRP